MPGVDGNEGVYAALASAIATAGGLGAWVRQIATRLGKLEGGEKARTAAHANELKAIHEDREKLAAGLKDLQGEMKDTLKQDRDMLYRYMERSAEKDEELFRRLGALETRTAVTEAADVEFHRRVGALESRHGSSGVN